MSYSELTKREQLQFLDWMQVNNQDQLLTDYELEKSHDVMLDECYPETKICGYEYSASDALKSVDPTAYRCSFADYLSNDYEEICAGNNVFYISLNDIDDLINDFKEELESLEGEE